MDWFRHLHVLWFFVERIEFAHHIGDQLDHPRPIRSVNLVRRIRRLVIVGVKSRKEEEHGHFFHGEYH